MTALSLSAASTVAGEDGRACYTGAILAMRRVLGATVLFLAAACSSAVDVEESASSAQTAHEPTIYPPLVDAPTTQSRTFTPASTIQAPDGPNPSKPSALTDYLARGFGDLTEGA